MWHHGQKPLEPKTDEKCKLFARVCSQKTFRETTMSATTISATKISATDNIGHRQWPYRPHAIYTWCPDKFRPYMSSNGNVCTVFVYNNTSSEKWRIWNEHAALVIWLKSKQVSVHVERQAFDRPTDGRTDRCWQQDRAFVSDTVASF